MRDSALNYRWVSGLLKVLATLMCVTCILWNIEAPTRLGFAVLPQQYMAFQLGLALAIAYLQFDFRGERKTSGNALNTSIAVIAFFTLMYAAWDFPGCWKSKLIDPGKLHGLVQS